MKTNYEILGLPENAPLEIVEKKYGALIRQYNQRTAEHGATYQDIEYYRSITKAYDELTGKNHDLSDENPGSVIPYKVRKKLGKIGAFFSTYKLLFLFIGLVIALIVIFFLQRNVKKEDLYIKVLGAYGSKNTDALCEEIDKKSNVTDSSLINFFTVTTSTEYSQAKESEATQFIAQYRAGYIDVILTDKESYEAYVDDFVFLKLDDFLEQHKGEAAFEGLSYYTYEKPADGTGREPESGIYGIDITECHFFDGMQFEWYYDLEKGQQKTLILTLARSSKRPEKAREFAIELIESLKQESAPAN